MPDVAYSTFNAILGRQEGEFYDEGWLIYAAFGWWNLLCFTLLVYEWIRPRGSLDASA